MASRKIDYTISAAVRRRLAGERFSEWSTRGGSGQRAKGIGTKCRRCRELLPFSQIHEGICKACHSDIVSETGDPDDRYRYRDPNGRKYNLDRTYLHDPVRISDRDRKYFIMG